MGLADLTDWAISTSILMSVYLLLSVYVQYIILRERMVKGMRKRRAYSAIEVKEDVESDVND